MFKEELNFTMTRQAFHWEPTASHQAIQQLEKPQLSKYTFDFSFIQKRDGTQNKPNINDIILTDGASAGITLMFNLLLKDPSDGVMIPIPQYPLYSAVITQCGAKQIPYYLVEEKKWSAEKAELESQYQKAKESGVTPRILVCINPGNPTGQVFDRQSIVDMIT